MILLQLIDNETDATFLLLQKKLFVYEVSNSQLLLKVTTGEYIIPKRYFAIFIWNHYFI